MDLTYENHKIIYTLLAKTVNFLSRVPVLLPRIKEKEIRAVNLDEYDKEVVESLGNKADLYRKLSHQENYDNFIMIDKCDSLLYSSLYHTFNPLFFIEAAKDYDNKWHRRPTYLPECYPLHSKSTISRDMLLGVMTYCWFQKELDILEELWDYGASHNWIMGEGDISRVYFTPSLQQLLAEMILALGGKDHYFARRIIPSYPSIDSISRTHPDFRLAGYECHLLALRLLLKFDVTGTYTKKEKKLVTALYQRNEYNPLFCYLDDWIKYGDCFCGTTSLLNDPRWFPEGRLPTSQDRECDWLPARDIEIKNGAEVYPGDPSPNVKIHTGGDFLFIYGLLRRHL